MRTNLDLICLDCFQECTEDTLYANGYLCYKCSEKYQTKGELFRLEASQEVSFLDHTISKNIKKEYDK